MSEFINLSLENIEDEHLFCAIGDKKHQEGVKIKEEWLKERIKEGHIVPCIFNNWANFKDGKYLSNLLLNKNMVDKLYR